MMILTNELLHVKIVRYPVNLLKRSSGIERCYNNYTDAGRRPTICNNARKICLKSPGVRAIIKIDGDLQIVRFSLRCVHSIHSKHIFKKISLCG